MPVEKCFNYSVLIPFPVPVPVPDFFFEKLLTKNNILKYDACAKSIFWCGCGYVLKPGHKCPGKCNPQNICPSGQSKKGILFLENVLRSCSKNNGKHCL